MENPSFSPESASTISEYYPNIEDWKEVQGGKPTFWLNEKGNNLKVVHAYNSTNPDFSGVVINTPLEQKGDTFVIPAHMSREVSFVFDDQREVRFPVFALSQYHGEPCEVRSSESHSQKGPSDAETFDPEEFETHKQTMKGLGYKEVVLLPNTKPQARRIFEIQTL